MEYRTMVSYKLSAFNLSKNPVLSLPPSTRYW
jgi:hypothetical protein